MTGEEVRQWRERYRYTQQQLAMEFGVMRQIVVVWENSGDRIARLVELALLGLQMGVLSPAATGRRMTASEHKLMRSRPDDPGARAARPSQVAPDKVAAR